MIHKRRSQLSGLTLLIAACGFSAAAQQVQTVRAVEHPEFSRIVLPLQSGVTHELAKAGSTVNVTLSGAAQEFDFSGVFDRMPRDRIRAVEATAGDDGSTVSISLGCDCDVSLVPIGSGYLAVDVRRKRDGTQQTGSRTLTAATPELRSSISDEIAATAPGPETAEAEAAQSAAAPLPDTPAPQVVELEPDARLGTRDPVLDEPADTPQPEDPVIAARRALVQQLDRAVAEGLLSLAPQADSREPTIASSQTPTDDPVATLPAPTLVPRLAATPTQIDPPDAEPPGPIDTPEGHISIRPGTVAVAEEPLPPEEETASVCTLEANLEIQLWPRPDGDFLDAVGTARKALLHEDGSPDPAGVAQLAQLYITQGFGREAEALLNVFATDLEISPLLHDLARIVEGRPLDGDGPLVAADTCGGRSLLWRAAAGLSVPELGSENWETLTTTLMELPPLLRRLVGHEVARAAVSSGALDAASDLFDLLDRTPGRVSAREHQVRAAFALAANEPVEALSMTSPMVDGIATPDPQALVLHARALLDAGQPPPPDTVSAIDNATVVFPASSATGELLRLAQAELRARDGDPLGGLEILTTLPGASPEERARARGAARAILEAVDPAERASVLGAEVILASTPFLTNDAESRALRLSYAQALTRGGLPNAALDLLDTSPEQVADRDIRMAKAQAYLDQGANAAVLEVTDGLSGEDVDTLRTQALFRSGDLLAAYRTATDAGSEQQDKLAVLTGRWDQLRSGDPEASFADLAEYARSQTDEGSAEAPPLPTLNRAQEELSAARLLRAGIEDALPQP